jgi:DNA-binding NtrC family response regulator
MASIVVAGSDAALLEGVAQVLAAGGHAVRVAHSLADACALAAAEPPVAAVLERGLMVERGAARPVLAPGGALRCYHAAESEGAALPARLQRAALADVTFPLERNRLVALVQSVVARQQVTGRVRRSSSTPRDLPPVE